MEEEEAAAAAVVGLDQKEEDQEQEQQRVRHRESVWNPTETNALIGACHEYRARHCTKDAYFTNCARSWEPIQQLVEWPIDGIERSAAACKARIIRLQTAWVRKKPPRGVYVGARVCVWGWTNDNSRNALSYPPTPLPKLLDAILEHGI
jgi:hypothetical protein